MEPIWEHRGFTEQWVQDARTGRDRNRLCVRGTITIDNNSEGVDVTWNLIYAQSLGTIAVTIVSRSQT
jgi:hypothetical protein